MFCHHCNRSFAEDALYCSQCGKPLLPQQNIGAEESGDWALALAETASSSDKEIGAINKKKRTIWIWLMPVGFVALALVTAASVLVYYQYEIKRNDLVLNLQHEAKTAALAGQYEEALRLLEEAADIRPQFTALREDASIVQHAAELSRQIAEAEEQFSAGQATESETERELERVKNELSGNKQPIYAKLRGKLDDLGVQLMVIRLTKEVEEISSFKELSETLNVVNGVIGEDAAILRETIIGKIKDISIAEANQLLGKKNFSAAVAAIDQALELAKGDEELLAKKQHIAAERSRYERAEQQRIEQAMQRAAEEDLINQTAAVEVVNIEQTLDEFGDLTIEGRLKNAATRPIYSVAVDFTVYGEDGEVAGKGSGTASPNYIEPGEEMSFTATVYGVYIENTSVVIDHVTWYLD